MEEIKRNLASEYILFAQQVNIGHLYRPIPVNLVNIGHNQFWAYISVHPNFLLIALKSKAIVTNVYKCFR